MNSNQVPAVTASIAEYALGARFDGETSKPLFELAKRAVVDTIGVAIAARDEETFRIASRVLTKAASANGSATVFPTAGRAPAADAALLNGIAGHALDFDDVTEPIYGHPSVVLVPAIFAVAEAQSLGGREVLEAYVAGFEIDCAIGRAIDIGAHYGRGWHATATIGVLGATAALARLLRLTVGETRMALGIAATMAGGSRQNFGSMTKPLHAGLAAHDAVLAVSLAAEGFTADAAQLEAPLGFFHLFGGDVNMRAVIGSLHSGTAMIDAGINIKKYPCCYNMQRLADAALALARDGARGEDIESINVALEPGGLRPLIHHRPSTGLQAKFSAEYVTAAAIVDGRLGLFSFTDEAVLRPEAQRLIARTTVKECAVPPFGESRFDYAYATVEVTRRDGAAMRVRCDVPSGDHRAPLSVREVEEKFRDCLAFSGASWDADALLGALWSIDRSPQVTLVPSALCGVAG